MGTDLQGRQPRVDDTAGSELTLDVTGQVAAISLAIYAGELELSERGLLRSLWRAAGT